MPSNEEDEMEDRFEICVENIGLHPFSRSRSFLPTLIQDGSAPQTWSIEPALPSFLAFDTTSGRNSQTTTTQSFSGNVADEIRDLGHERLRQSAATGIVRD